jgi:hypothetical protein
MSALQLLRRIPAKLLTSGTTSRITVDHRQAISPEQDDNQRRSASTCRTVYTTDARLAGWFAVAVASTTGNFAARQPAHLARLRIILCVGSVHQAADDPDPPMPVTPGRGHPRPKNAATAHRLATYEHQWFSGGAAYKRNAISIQQSEQGLSNPLDLGAVLERVEQRVA